MMQETVEPTPISPGEPERISESDRMMIVRMESRIVALQQSAQDLQQFVTNHLAAVYGLGQGDRIEDDRVIVRQGGADAANTGEV